MLMDHDREREIIASVLRGDRQVYALLVDAYKGPVFNLAYRMTGSLPEAEDLAQETFILAYEKLWRWRPEKMFFVWLYTIGLNLIRNHLKKKQKSEKRDADWAEGPERGNAEAQAADHPEGLLLEDERQKLLQACLLRLSADLREAVVLRFYEDQPFENIARVCGISLSSAKMRVYRGIEKLQGMMGKLE
jgi:RNA polymerase sigma-70 factor (ECF subfamily)